MSTSVDLSWAQPGAYAVRDRFGSRDSDVYRIERLTPSLIVCKVPEDLGGNGYVEYRFRRSDGRAYGRGERGTITPVTDEQVLAVRVAAIARKGVEEIRRLPGVDFRAHGARVPAADTLEQIAAIIGRTYLEMGEAREAAKA